MGTTNLNDSTVFSISDAPLNSTTFSAINITVDKIIVYSTTDHKWYVVSNGTEQFNLVKLKNISQIMYAAKLPSGNYSAIILNVTNSSVTVNGTVEHMYIPSDRLVIPAKFNVTDNTTNWINLDFNLSSSIIVAGSGKAIMLPVIKGTYFRGARLKIGQSGILEVKAQGKAEGWEKFGMSVNGTMEENKTMPFGAQIDVGSNGKIFMGNMLIEEVVIRGNGSFTIAKINTTSILNKSWPEMGMGANESEGHG